MEGKNIFKSLFINLIPILLPVFGFIIFAISVATLITSGAKKKDDYEGKDFTEEPSTSVVRSIEQINIC